MKSLKRGKDISVDSAEVVGIGKAGVWLQVGAEAFFMAHAQHPWFYKAPVAAVLNVEFHHGYHLRWPDLDVDLELDALRHPEKYPLRYRPGPKYVVVIEKAKGNYSAYVPDLLGCVAAADTIEETELLIREAIGVHIKGIEADGEPLPERTIIKEVEAICATGKHAGNLLTKRKH